jgi:hypothetical protein
MMTYELLRERHLLELHLVHAASVCGAHQRARSEENGRLHNDDGKASASEDAVMTTREEKLLGEAVL